ncbi:uncharacterized protein LOC125300750 [Alosa alosa]|uniref:uncharacterized protein LOC125300750 n=1 Tax=Alosa alosa TaxID=278164 RepID=UPI0020151392|nr:uncharacterized protein LOC125300750 [Alosa alosa]
MYSKYRYQDDILSQLHFLCTDPEYRWKTATCILSLVVILSWLLGRWRQEDEDCCDPDSDLLMYLSSQINTLDTECLNSEELLKEITANIVNCTARKKAHKHDAYSSQSEDTDVGLSDLFSHNPILWETLSGPTQKSGRDHMFLQKSYDDPSSESEKTSHTSGLGRYVGLSDYSISTMSTTINSSSFSLCPTSSDISLSDEMSESDQSSLTTISTVTTASNCGLKVSRQRQLWKRAILFVRIVVMLLPQRLRQKKYVSFQEWKGEENMNCSDTSVISDSHLDSSDNSFQHKRAMFEKYFKIAEAFNKQPKPLMPNQSQHVGQAQTDLKKEKVENIMASVADGPPVLPCLGKEVTDALERSLKCNMGNVHLQNKVPLTCQDLYDNGSPPSSSELGKALESEITPLYSRHCRGDETKENVTARRPHFVVADQNHERNDQTSFWEVKPVTIAANYQSLRLETADIKDNSSQEDSQKPNSPVKGRGTHKDMVDGIITLGGTSVELADKQKCQEEITFSQHQIPSGSGLNSCLKSASEPDLSTLSSREAKAQGVDKVALNPINLNLRQMYWERKMKTPTLYHPSLRMLTTNAHGQWSSKKHLEKETPPLEEARTLTFTKGIKGKLEFNIKQKVLYQLLGLPLVVQRSLDTTMRTSHMVKDLKMLPNSSEEETLRKLRQERTSLQKWNFPKRIVKSLKTFEMPKAMGLKNLSLCNDKKTKKSKMPLSNDNNQGPAIQDSCKRSDTDTETGNTGHSSHT